MENASSLIKIISENQIVKYIINSKTSASHYNERVEIKMSSLKKYLREDDIYDI